MVRERAEREGATSTMPLHSGLSVAEIRQLITLLNSSDLEELSIEQESIGLRLVLRKPPVPTTPSIGAEVEMFEPEGQQTLEESAAANACEVRAPLVGIFRASLKLGGRPLAVEGEPVREGQVVGAIEALNVLNEIEAPSAGRIKTLLVSEGQAVEYGQPLLVIDSTGR